MFVKISILNLLLNLNHLIIWEIIIILTQWKLFSTDFCLGNQISYGEYLFYYQKKILKLIWWNFMRRNFMGFSMTSWKYLGQNYDRLHNKNTNDNNTGKKVYNRNSLGKSLFAIWATQKSVENGNKIKGNIKIVFDKLKNLLSHKQLKCIINGNKYKWYWNTFWSLGLWN